MALRRSGLTHYVAVSGSNVALVLAAWWLIVAPLGAGVRLRAATGLMVLAVFVVVTRWESSVLRAATMASLVLGGRILSIPVDAWTALGLAVTVLLGMSGDLAYDIGFQLSVAATSGVLLGVGLWRERKPRAVWATLAATTSAQLAVVPLLLVHFGTVPLLSPLANLAAAPLVTVATALAGGGVVIGWDPLLVVADRAAAGVLQIARIAEAWPQLDVLGATTVVGGVVLAWRTPLRRVVAGGVVAVALVAMIPPGPPAVPEVTFLDVGQGDSVLVRDPSGAVALLDGGREPAVLGDHLRHRGIRRIDLLIASHGDADHVGGLSELAERVAIGQMWIPAFQPPSDLLAEVVAEVQATGAAIHEVSAGVVARLGEYGLEVLGPRRRYADENDGSVVLMLSARGSTVLLPGDVGAIAQRELPPLLPDLLMVPHHGSATTDPAWLEAVVGTAAVISVGENSYGHPDPAIISVLERQRVAVRTTLERGSVTVAFQLDGLVLAP